MRRRVSLGLLLALAVAPRPGAAQSDDWASLGRYRQANAALGAPAPGEVRVVFFGNSITEAWAPLLSEMFPGKPYVGRGISGQTTPQMLVRFRQDVIALDPAVVVILAGTNDIAGNTGPSTLEMIEDNLESMVELARAHGIAVVLSSVLPAADYPWHPGLNPGPKIVRLNAWMRRYARDHGVVYLDYHSAMADGRLGLPPELSGDGVHPNEAGYRVMAPLAQAAIARARGSRSFTRRLALEDSGATSANVSLGDLNGDGHLDIVLVKGRHWPLENLVRLGDGTGSFQPAYALGGPPDRSYSGALVDMDGDGDLDVVVSNDHPDPKVVHLNDGTGRFTVASTFGEGDWSTRHISVADLDGDGLQDVILANRYGPRTGPSYACFGVEGGRFGDHCVAVSQGSATTITVADFNGDGSPDLVVPHRDGGQSFIYLNDGEGGFAERRPFGPPDATIRSAEPADLDGDGYPDLAVIDERTGPAIFRGKPDGTFSAAEPLGRSGAPPYAIHVADVDGNGRVDVIVGYVESRPVVFFNDGPDRFTAVPFGDAQGRAYGFDVGDVDEDGFLDIAMARTDAPNMLYFGGPAER